MKIKYLIIFAGFLIFQIPANAQQDLNEFYKNNLLHFLNTADFTAHVRLAGVKEIKEIRQRHINKDGTATDDGPIGMIRYTMKAEVLEIFKGPKAKDVEYTEFHDYPSAPRTGEYIVSLNKLKNGSYTLADESGLVIPVSAELIKIAREYLKPATQ